MLADGRVGALSFQYVVHHRRNDKRIKRLDEGAVARPWYQCAMKYWQVSLFAAVICLMPVSGQGATPADPCKLASASDVAAAVSGPTGPGQASSDPAPLNMRRCRWTGPGGRLADVALNTDPEVFEAAKSAAGSAAKTMNNVVPGAMYAEGKIAFVKHGYYVVVQTVNPTDAQPNTAASPSLVKFAQAVARRL